MMLPEGYIVIAMDASIILAQTAEGYWATWRTKGDLIDEGHIFCRRCPNAEELARADYADRIKKEV